MFTHNLKIAFRNMRKYFNQTLISVIGLAVGFTCFALATLWIRYEMSFDGFHKKAKQMYVVYRPSSPLQTETDYGRIYSNIDVFHCIRFYFYPTGSQAFPRSFGYKNEFVYYLWRIACVLCRHNTIIVVCVLADTVYISTQKSSPAVYMKTTRTINPTTVLFKYREDMWKACQKNIEQMIESEFADWKHTITNIEISNSEETYNKFLKSEQQLMQLLFFVSLICILICIFGFVSVVSLACEERRKEIAVRKVHGATASNILLTSSMRHPKAPSRSLSHTTY